MKCLKTWIAVTATLLVAFMPHPGTASDADMKRKNAALWRRQCNGGHFGGPDTRTLCSHNWPMNGTKRLWFVIFHAEWCGACKHMEPEYGKLVQHFEPKPRWGIGHIDCSRDEQWCDKVQESNGRKIKGFPTIWVLSRGRHLKDFNGERGLKSMIRFLAKTSNKTYDQSLTCNRGIFASTADVKYSVQPLCAAEFPDAKMKASWLVLLYDQSIGDTVRDALDSAAIDLGNTKAAAEMSREKQFAEVATKHALSLSIPKDLKGAFSANGALAKVGGVCCDCDEDTATFCSTKFKGRIPGPQLYWVTNGFVNPIYPTPELNTKGFVNAALSSLLYASKQATAKAFEL